MFHTGAAYHHDSSSPKQKEAQQHKLCWKKWLHLFNFHSRVIRQLLPLIKWSITGNHTQKGKRKISAQQLCVAAGVFLHLWVSSRPDDHAHMYAEWHPPHINDSESQDTAEPPTSTCLSSMSSMYPSISFLPPSRSSFFRSASIVLSLGAWRVGSGGVPSLPNSRVFPHLHVNLPCLRVWAITAQAGVGRETPGEWK